jgi:hypothetical protein
MDDERPLGPYALFVAIFNAGLLGGLFGLRRDLPDRLSGADMALLTVSTHKISRLIAKDKVTAPLRAPFAQYEEDAGPSEVSESSRGTGMRKAVGDLITCPYCLSQWVATIGLFGLALAPRPTRFIATLFTIVTGADFLQIAYKAAQEKGLE